MAEYTETQITAADGYRLSARFFSPPDKAKAAVLIVPAMATRQGFYRAFAAWLADQGYLVATFDYRGIGQSLHGPLRGFKTDILQWARLDCAAMVDTLAARAPALPLLWVGHSLGGQIGPFVPNRERISKMIFIASGMGYWRTNPAPVRWMALWLWYVVVPLALLLFDCFPGRRLRKIGDLPAGAIAQWRRWCLHPQYAYGVEGEWAQRAYAELCAPITALSFTDDEMMSRGSIESLLGFYRSAPKTHKVLKPKQLGIRRIGHFGFFRPEQADTLWRPELLPELA